MGWACEGLSSCSTVIVACAGTIPEDLEGTLLRNGPGLFEIGGIPVSQPFDGDGMVSHL